MWPFTKKKSASERAENLRWVANNMCGMSLSFSGIRPDGTDIGDVTSALHELADRIDADAEQPSKGE